MKRRKFLALIGAATAAPALPLSAAPAAALPVNRFTYGLVALHTRIEGGLPLSEIARRFGLSGGQADALAQKLVQDGFATRTGGMVTANRPFLNARGFGHGRTRARGHPSRAKRTAHPQPEPGLPPLLAHLRHLCARRGMVLAPARLA